MILLGHLIFIIVCITVLFLFLLNFRREILEDSLKISFILIIVLIFVSIASVTLKYSIDSIYLIPFAIIPIIIRTFYDARLALFIHIIVVMLVGFFAPNGFEFVFLNFIAGIIAIFSLTDLHRRGKLFLSAFLVVITYSIIYFGMSITYEGNVHDIKWENFLYFGANGVLLLLSYPLIYVFEKVFGFLSEVTLLELSDTNQPLLRLLAEKAPGTFQHSLQVANLAEDAVYKIGGNPLLVRTGALYHDVGKMDNSICFIENQNSGYNPHDYLELDESAKIIINHIIIGEKIAKKYKLPIQIIDFIKTHHGTSRVEYFYRLFKNKFPDKTIDEKKFTYPGVKPYSIETAVLMMADTVEAASRSIEKIDENAINNLVDSLIDKQIANGQYEDAPLTFKDVSIIKRIFKQKLVNIYHARIEYPKEIKDENVADEDVAEK
jgi:putative nucleotidyltransferase with HDIG domain